MTPTPTPAKDDTGELPDSFDAYHAEFVYEHRVGLRICPYQLWLSWDETVALHKWLSAKIAGETEPQPRRPDDNQGGVVQW